MKRVVILLLDGVGIGAMPDAADYGDADANSLSNVARAVGSLDLPNLQRLGLGNITPLLGCPANPNAQACFGRMAERSRGKDSTAGHWEITGVVTEREFERFPNGFPDELVRSYERAIGIRTIGNVAISGTEVIRLLGEEHLHTGYPIIYTSADSVFQVACHEDLWPVSELYRMCRIARALLSQGRNPNLREVGAYPRTSWQVGRVIARPFAGKPGEFCRTPRRKDFSLEPAGETLLDRAKAAGLEVSLVGKLDDLFAGRGFTRSFHSVNNMACLDQTLLELRREFSGVLFTNLIQFDMDWGHRNDVRSYCQGLQEFDRRLTEVLAGLKPDDLLFITADHGNDPTTPSTDHSREYVPLLAFGTGIRGGVNLGTRTSFADLGQTAAEYLGLPGLDNGTSFLKEITR
jgi:phosphopentomutase